MRFQRITPAQAYGHPDFVTDVPIQGPTDEGIRAADCWWTQNVLPVRKPACVDCRGPIPLWAKNPTAWNGGPPEYGGNGGPNCRGEILVHNGRRVAGFALDGHDGVRGWSVAEYRDGGSLSAAGDPAATFTSDQQAWVVATLNSLNTNIGQSTGTSCTSWQDAGTNLAAAVGCFQFWANGNGKGSLRTDGVLDQDTLKLLVQTAQAHAGDFPTMFPTAPAVPEPPPAPAAPAAPVAPAAPAAPPPPEPPPVDNSGAVVEAGMTKNAKLALGIASAIVVGGVVYTATRRRKKS
jgi:hypothetical protein